MAVTGAEVASAAKILGASVKAIPWTALVQKYQAYNLIIIGQERSGKTTLTRFLSRKHLGYRDEKIKPTVGHEDTGGRLFQWTTESGGNLSCAFRNIGDYSGQTEPAQIAKMITNKQPHLIIIVLDITKRDPHAGIHGSYMNWLNDMCEHLADILSRRPLKRRNFVNSLRQVVILLNKVDCLETSERSKIAKETEDNVKDIITDNLRALIPNQKLNSFAILPCSLVSNPLYGKVEDTVSRLEKVMAAVAMSIPPPNVKS
jgi:GTPase SAR1 family protein